MKRIIKNAGKMLVLVVVFFIGTSGISKREKVVYIGTNGKLASFEEAVFMQKINNKSNKEYKVQTFVLQDSEWKKLYTENYKKLNDSTYQINGNGEDIPAKCLRVFKKQADNTWKFRDQVDGMIERSGYAQSLVPLLLHGKVTEYHPGGNKKSISIYNNNELVSNKNWTEEGEKYIDNIFYSVDKYPTYKGNIKELHEHIMKGYKESGIATTELSGSVVVGFVVMEDGTIDGIKILKGLGPNINSVAYEAFKSFKGDWTPATLNGKTVKYFQVFPINFIYNENQFEFAELRGAILHFQTY